MRGWPLGQELERGKQWQGLENCAIWLKIRDRPSTIVPTKIHRNPYPQSNKISQTQPVWLNQVAWSNPTQETTRAAELLGSSFGLTGQGSIQGIHIPSHHLKWNLLTYYCTSYFLSACTTNKLHFNSCSGLWTNSVTVSEGQRKQASSSNVKQSPVKYRISER